MGEVTKLATCLILVFYEQERNAYKFGRSLRKTIIDNKLDTLKVCVPSLLYVIQNNLLYVSAANLDAATNQVCLRELFTICSQLVTYEMFFLSN